MCMEDSEWPDWGPRPFPEPPTVPKEVGFSGPGVPLETRRKFRMTKLTVTTVHCTLELLCGPQHSQPLGALL